MADRLVNGDVASLTNTFKVGGTATDPTTVALAVTEPGGTTITYTLAGGTVTKTTTGVFTRDVAVSTNGIWSYKWTGTGAAADVADGSFEVHPAQPPTASSVDILTLLEARQALNMNADDLDRVELLSAAITAVSRTLDEVCGPIVARTVTAERHDGGTYDIQLRHWPIAAVTTVTEYSGTTATTLTEETIGTAPANGYLLDPYSGLIGGYTGRIRRRSSGSDYTFPTGSLNVAVTYTAGRFTTTSAVTEQFKHAGRITLENWWQQFREGIASVGEFDVPITAFPRFAIPQAARQLLGGEVHDDPVRVG